MTSRAHARRMRRTTRAWIIGGTVALVVAALVVMALVVAPRVIPNLRTTVAEADSPEPLTAGSARARVTVPAGWAYHYGWGDDELVLRSPDGRLSVTLTLRDAAPRANFDAARSDLGDAADGFGSTASERLASGLDVVHAQDGAAGTLLAAVGATDAGPSVGVVAKAPADALVDYRAVVARLVEGIEVPA